MAAPQPSVDPKSSPTGAASAFGVLDECHRHTLGALATLEAVVASLDCGPVDAQTRTAAAAVVRHFSTTARQHHEDEERHVFPKLAASSDVAMQQAVSRLLQDHLWLEEDWRELQPALDAIACGQSWFDVAVLREGAGIFAALSREHIALEESCLYPVARALLGAGELHYMEREMTARRRAARKPGSGATAPSGSHGP